jgi:type II secretory pathway predicted ATPase ExeA
MKLLKLKRISILEMQVTLIRVYPEQLVRSGIQRNNNFMNDGADVKALQQLRREAPRTINNVVTNC